ncbi:DUF4112 domain-containing protein [Hasllibacter sp. MH4015]|uniref:DUF4112 domain-containing protein n=1 Tax=Hasllibacter sp. MH4015 TaxID=2854029 RepID=UPI001CD4B396|nr:DUF4112 domain-containing protein [Hasllibacter sp. MH4015]
MTERDPLEDIEHLERLAIRMDSAFRIPGTGFRVGYDSIVGLIPGIGDALTLAPSLYILWKAWQMGVSLPRLARMGGNVALDTLIGGIPVLGDLFDAAFKANRRNVALVRAHVERQNPTMRHKKGPRAHAARLQETI